MPRKFRPLEESIAIVKTMIARETNAYDYDPDADAIEYWTRRKNGYLKLLAQRDAQKVQENGKKSEYNRSLQK